LRYIGEERLTGAGLSTVAADWWRGSSVLGRRIGGWHRWLGYRALGIVLELGNETVAPDKEPMRPASGRCSGSGSTQ
jgi:hypothetical protein